MSVCEMLGIEHPIVQAPMADVPQLAAAVSDAGALGMVALTWSADVGAVVRETAALTARPFGGNLVLTDDRHDRLEAALEAGLRIVSFFMGDPSGYVKPVHDAGGIVLHTVGTAEEARRAVASGVDVIVAQGWEAGGHVWSTIATLPLVALAARRWRAAARWSRTRARRRRCATSRPPGPPPGDRGDRR